MNMSWIKDCSSCTQCNIAISDVSAATMYDVLHDNVYRKTWDPAMLESFEIARLAPNADVGYYSCESYKIYDVLRFLYAVGSVRSL